MSQVPCSDIEYWGSYRPENRSGAKYKILHRIAVTFLIFNIIIFPLDGFQPHHPLFILTIHVVILKHCSLCFHYVKFPPCVTSINYFFVQTWFQLCAPGISLKIGFFPVLYNVQYTNSLGISI